MDCVDEAVRIGAPDQVVIARELDQRGANNALGQVKCFFDLDPSIAFPVEYESGHMNRVEDTTDIDFGAPAP
ncbi:hypothetical protein ACVINZ_002198 [Mesorhizobium jarvisii]